MLILSYSLQEYIPVWNIFGYDNAEGQGECQATCEKTFYV